METRYTVELMGNSSYYEWDDAEGFMMFRIKSDHLYTDTDTDEDYQLAVF